MAVVKTFLKKCLIALIKRCFFALGLRISQKIPTLLDNPFQNQKQPARHFLVFSRLSRDFSVHFLIFPTNGVKGLLACPLGSLPKPGKRCRNWLFLGLFLTTRLTFFLFIFRGYFLSVLLLLFQALLLRLL